MRISELPKEAGRLLREILVAWSNFGKERASVVEVGIENIEGEAGQPVSAVLEKDEFSYPNEEPFGGICPSCGEKKWLTAWVKTRKMPIPRLYCDECASSLKLPGPDIPMPTV